MTAVRFCLDYPGVNCRQCADNLKTDEIEPDCAGAGGSEACPVASWDSDVTQAMALYERVCPWGELNYTALNDALNDLQIPKTKHRLMRGLLPAIHREIKNQQHQRPTEI